MNKTHPFTPTPTQAAALQELGRRLVDQHNARVIVPPQENASGFWFGGGNLARDRSGTLWLVGRYRNCGDSRTGLQKGSRGLELAVFRLDDMESQAEKVLSFGKEDLTTDGQQVLSIEGTSLHPTSNGVELYLSTEKDMDYPAGFEAFRKPGTGVWTVDIMSADAVVSLPSAKIRTVVKSREAARAHTKDPVVFERDDGNTALIYCTHPFSWSSSNTSVALRDAGASTFTLLTDQMLQRGPVWDVAVTRVTDRLAVPRAGLFKEAPPLSLYFYDGAECMRSHEEHGKAVRRPRGHSCEEIGGLAWGVDARFPAIHRLSVNEPLFISPWGSGSSRYVSTLREADRITATWQQSQSDRSQPLVGHSLPMAEVEHILHGG